MNSQDEEATKIKIIVKFTAVRSVLSSHVFFFKSSNNTDSHLANRGNGKISVDPNRVDADYRYRDTLMH